MHKEYSLPDSSIGTNVIIFGAHNSSSMHINNKRKDILIFGKDITQGLINSTLAAEALCSVTFTRPGIKFCLHVHSNGSNSFLFVNATKNISVQSKRL